MLLNRATARAPSQPHRNRGSQRVHHHLASACGKSQPSPVLHHQVQAGWTLEDTQQGTDTL